MECTTYKDQEFELPANLFSAWIRGGGAGACAHPEFSGSSTKHSNVPPPEF